MNEFAPARFDLLEEPWIPVRYLDGSAGEVSIRTAFHRAAEIREITGELPTQTFALTRLLLAILYRATHDPDAAGWHEEDWGTWWRGGLPVADLDDYLDEFSDRFDLFHPERPFFQVAGLRTTKDETKDTAPLILDLPGNNRLFTNRAGAESLRLPPSEAARWLVNAQAFDPSGIKSGAAGDPRTKGGKGYPIGLAWSGLLGGLLAEGRNLHETLLLNFVLPGPYLDLDGAQDLPPWEEEHPDTAAERAGIAPHGPVRLFTWQSRRVRLVIEGAVAVGCVLANGDALTPQNLQRHEPHTAWRYSEPQTKKLGRATYMPREHLADRSLWRGIGALLPGAPSAQRVDGVQRYQVPALVDFLNARITAGDLEENHRLRLRAIGVIYGSNNSVVDDVIDDRISLALVLLSTAHPELATAAEDAVQLADEGVRALRTLAGNLAQAAGGDGEGARARAEERGYSSLDGPYRAWLASLNAQSVPADALAEWRGICRNILRAIGGDLVRSASPTAWVGREVTSRIGTELMNTSRAEIRFLRKLNTIFASDTEQPRGEDTAS